MQYFLMTSSVQDSKTLIQAKTVTEAMEKYIADLEHNFLKKINRTGYKFHCEILGDRVL